MQRRKFLSESFLGASALYAAGGIPPSTGVLLQGMKAEGEKARLESPHLNLEYDLGSGRVSLYAVKDKKPLLLNATAAAVFPRGMALASDANYTRRSRVAASGDPGIEGEQLVITCADTAKNLNLEQQITLLRDRPGAVFELVLTNVSKKEILVRHAEPLRALLDEHSGCFFGAEGAYSAVQKVLRHGYLYSDPGEVMDMVGHGRRDFTSVWNAAYYIPGTQETLVVGYLENRQAEGHIYAAWNLTRAWQGGHGAFDLTGRSFYNRTFVLKPGASISSGRLLVLLSPDPFSGLEYYAETYGRLHGVKLNPILNGWCSWAYTHTRATEDEQLKNAEFIGKYLKPYGMEWVQIDDGYQRAFGDWEGNELYPHGMKWLAGKIRELGLKPGIWVAPYVISENTDVARNHPEWLVHDAAGEVYVTASTRAKHALDITHPGARQWLHDLFKSLARDWGYDFIKIDFVEWTLLAAERYYDPTIGKAGAYRLGFETMRAAVGPERHLLDCGPGPTTVGLLDSMRIDQDLPRTTWEQYTKHFCSNAPSMAKRYYFHKRTWINDNDHLGLARLTVPQARAAASIIALSGGTTISSDRVYELDPDRLDILRKVLPAYGEAARPLDLFEKSFPEIFALKVRKDFGEWWLLGYFNYDEGATVVRDFDLTRLGLDPLKTYLVYEFWTQRLVAEASRSVRLVFEPSSVNFLAIHEKRDVPQVVGTDRHYAQGALELQDVRWDAASRTLSGTGLGAPGTAWRIAIYVPQGYVWDENGLDYFHDYQNFSAISFEKNILRARLEFGRADRVSWSFKFR